MFRTDAVKFALIGLMRDLRGIAMATNRLAPFSLHNNNSLLKSAVVLIFFPPFIFSRRTYGLLFDWIYPAHMPVLLKGISHWADTPEV